MKLRFLLILFGCLLFAVDILRADPPATLTYQGRLKTIQGVPVNTPTNIVFRIYDVATGGVKLWEEAHTNVAVENGIFMVILGKTASLAGLAFDKTYYMGLELNGGEEMTPRLEMTSSPYAMNTVKQTSNAAETLLKTLTTPKSVAVAPSGSGQASVTWNAVDGATSYNLYLATETGVNASNYTTKANGKVITGVTSPYTVTGLTNGIEYFFALASVTPVGESTVSTEAKATTLARAINSLGMEFEIIPAGTFTMGSPSAETGRYSYETQHSVTISNPFFMQTTEVTQGQWRAVMGSNPSYFSSCGDSCPVEQVSWDDIQSFLTAINAKGEGTYRLPTEAEWEYAARAGTTTAYSFGASETPLGDYTWYSSNSSSKTHPVGQKLPNAWGLYDMHGNVWEWVSDRYGDYSSSAATDPVGSTGGSRRVSRGGSWSSDTGGLRSADRGGVIPGSRSSSIGFRLVAASPGP